MYHFTHNGVCQCNTRGGRGHTLQCKAAAVAAAAAGSGEAKDDGKVDCVTGGAPAL